MRKPVIHQSAGTKGRGRTNITRDTSGSLGPTPSRPNAPITAKTKGNRPTSSAQRGDRRDMNRQYTGTTKHAARGQTGRIDRSTRKD